MSSQEQGYYCEVSDNVIRLVKLDTSATPRKIELLVPVFSHQKRTGKDLLKSGCADFDSIKDQMSALVFSDSVSLHKPSAEEVANLNSTDDINHWLEKVCDSSIDELKVTFIDAATGGYFDTEVSKPGDLLAGCIKSSDLAALEKELSDYDMQTAALFIGLLAVSGAVKAELVRQGLSSSALIVDIGLNKTAFVQVNNRGIQTVASVPVGMTQVIEGVQEQLNLKFAGSAAKLFFDGKIDFKRTSEKLASAIIEAAREHLADLENSGESVPELIFCSQLPAKKEFLTDTFADATGLKPLELDLDAVLDQKGLAIEDDDIKGATSVGQLGLLQFLASDQESGTAWVADLNTPNEISGALAGGGDSVVVAPVEISDSAPEAVAPPQPEPVAEEPEPVAEEPEPVAEEPEPVVEEPEPVVEEPEPVAEEPEPVAEEPEPVAEEPEVPIQEELSMEPEPPEVPVVLESTPEEEEPVSTEPEAAISEEPAEEPEPESAPEPEDLQPPAEEPSPTRKKKGRRKKKRGKPEVSLVTPAMKELAEKEKKAEEELKKQESEKAPEKEKEEKKKGGMGAIIGIIAALIVVVGAWFVYSNVLAPGTEVTVTEKTQMSPEEMAAARAEAIKKAQEDEARRKAEEAKQAELAAEQERQQQEAEAARIAAEQEAARIAAANAAKLAAQQEEERLANARGGIYLDSVPAGAKVMLDGEEIGVTPVQKNDLKLNTYSIVLEKPGYTPVTLPAEVKENEITRLDQIKLVSLMGSLSINSQPEGLAYTIRPLDEGTEIINPETMSGITAASVGTLLPGSYEVVVNSEREPAQISTVEISQGGEAAVNADFRLGSAVINTEPQGMQVFNTGGELLGETPLTLADQVPGTVTYRLTREGFEESEVEVEYKRGEETVVTANVISFDDVIVASMLDVPPKLTRRVAVKGPRNEKGLVVVRIVIDERGRPQEPEIKESSNPKLDRAVLTAVKGMRFDPAERQGRKVKTVIELPFQFR